MKTAGKLLAVFLVAVILVLTLVPTLEKGIGALLDDLAEPSSSSVPEPEETPPTVTTPPATTPPPTTPTVTTPSATVPPETEPPVVTPEDPEEEEAESAVERLKQLCEPDSAVFAFVTDLHFAHSDRTVKSIVRAINRIDTERKLGFVAFGGDNLAETAPDLAAHLTKAARLSAILSGLEPPYVVMKGNHDDNTIGADFSGEPCGTLGFEMTDSHFYRLFCRQNEEGDAVRLDSARGRLCSLVDLEAAKLRCIFLNSVDIPYLVEDGKLKYSGIRSYGYSGEQLAWLAGTALDFGEKENPSEWAVVLLEHIPFSTQMYYDCVRANSEVLDGILAAYRSGEAYRSASAEGDFPYDIDADFTAQGEGEIIAAICGHVHADLDLFTDGMLQVSTLHASAGNVGTYASADKITYQKSLGETAFDVFTVDRDGGTLSTVRYGVGVNRIFHFRPVSVAAGETVLLSRKGGGAVWQSGNPTVATVEGGAVTARSPGTARITATDADGSYEVFYIAVP